MQIFIHPTRKEALTLSSDACTLVRWSLATNHATKLVQRSVEGVFSYHPTGAPFIKGGGITATPDGRFFALAHHYSPESVAAVDTLELLQWDDFATVWMATLPEITSPTASPDGRWLVAAGASQRILLLDRLCGQVLSDHHVIGYNITGLTFDPTSTFVAGV